jgi:hypothetical protein
MLARAKTSADLPTARRGRRRAAGGRYLYQPMAYVVFSCGGGCHAAHRAKGTASEESAACWCSLHAELPSLD